MYLARKLRWKESSYDMVGALPADVVMHDHPVGRGYVELQATANAPWPVNRMACRLHCVDMSFTIPVWKIRAGPQICL
jgi:cobyrinic acid a,c-diamide synthase